MCLPLGRQAEQRLCNFRMDRMLLQWGLESEVTALQMEQAAQPQQMEQAAQPPPPVP